MPDRNADIGGPDFTPENADPGDLDALYGVAGNGLPLAQLFTGVGAEAAQNGVSVMNAALATGTNPRSIANDLSNTLGVSQARALTIARTEMLGAWRDAQLINYRANSDVLDGWIWSASLASACFACMMMDGTVHPLDEELDGHPNCACSPIPLTKSWDDLLGDIEGIDTSLLEETDYLNAGYDDGMGYFLQQDAATQRSILGPAKFEAWQSGDVQLLDFVGQRDAGAWGNEIYERSLKEIGLDANAYLGRTTLADVNDLAFAPAREGAFGSAGELATYDLTAEDKAFVQALKEQLPDGGITTSDEAINLGMQIHDRITSDISDLQRFYDEFNSIKTRGGLNLTDAEQAWVRGQPDAIAAHNGLKITDIEKAYKDAYQSEVRAYLGEMRELGGEVDFVTEAKLFNEWAADSINSAADFIPSDWLRASNDMGRITPLRTGRGGIGGYLKGLLNGNAQLALIDPGDAVSARALLVGQSSALHEMMHRMEQTLPIISDIEAMFYEMRTVGEEAVKLTNGIDWTTKLDEWRDEYLGREPFALLRPAYEQSDGSFVDYTDTYELLSMGAEMTLAPGVTPEDFALIQDEQYAAFILGMLFGVYA